MLCYRFLVVAGKKLQDSTGRKFGFQNPQVAHGFEAALFFVSSPTGAGHPGCKDFGAHCVTASVLMGSMGSVGLDRPRPLPPRVVLVTF